MTSSLINLVDSLSSSPKPALPPRNKVRPQLDEEMVADQTLIHSETTIPLTSSPDASCSSFSASMHSPITTIDEGQTQDVGTGKRSNILCECILLSACYGYCFCQCRVVILLLIVFLFV